MESKRKILVCGATGFIGRNVAERLANREELEVHATYHLRPKYENLKIQFHYADLTKKEEVDEAVKGMDVIIQMAATTSGSKDIVSRPFIHVTDNAVMNSLIFRAAHEQGIKHVIFPSCTIMYLSSSTPLKETDFNSNAELYKSYFGAGWTKVYLEKMCEFYSRLGKTKYTVFRHSNVYGPHDKFDLEKSHVFGATITKVMTAQDKIIVWGAGEEERDLIYVSDIVEFIELALDKQSSAFELVNVGCGKAIAIKDLVSNIISISGKKIQIEYDLSKPSIKTALCLDCTKAAEVFGWKPKTALDEGIGKTIEWYKMNILRQ